MIKDIVRVLLTPSCWLQNYRYSRVWDTEFEKLLSNNKFINTCRYSSKLGIHILDAMSEEDCITLWGVGK